MPYTVVITSFNSISTIEQVINKVRDLIPAPSQVLLIDDASQDGSSVLIKNLISDLPHFDLRINSKNMGQSYSRNLGVKLSLNEYVVFQDDDDLPLSNRASIHLEALDRGADFSYVSSKKRYPNGYEVVNLNMELLSSPSINREIIRFLSAGLNPRDDLRVFSPSSTLAARKSTLMALGGFSLELRRLEDIELACRALMNGFQLSWSNKIGVVRLHTAGGDKSPKANYMGELEVLRLTKGFFSRKEYFVARRMISLRAAYLQKNLPIIFFNMLSLPFILIFSPTKIYSIIQRVQHDIRRNR